MTDVPILRAAGVLFVTPDKRALFLKRGPGGSFPGYWCFPGGAIEADETPEQAARREANEEIGKHPAGKLQYHTRSVRDDGTGPVDFTTFGQRVDEEFTPTLNEESAGYAWAPLSDPPQPLHPGCQVAIARMDMDELGVARAIAAGELTSPQLYGNVWLFDLRITGTGVAYRGEKRGDKKELLQAEEFVYRRPENYLTPEFVARCNGLPVIMLHPPGAVLNSKEFASRVVGSMMVPYVKGDEVWGIAKIYDDDAVKLLTSSQMSTSPGVILGEGNRRMKTEDGTDILIEGKPSLLDHLAICERGVWDKGGEPRGVRTDSQGELDMPLNEEDMKVLDTRFQAALASSLPAMIAAGLATARADDAGGQKLDKLLSCIDSLAERMDSMAKRVDAFEKKEDSDEDDKEKKADEDEESEAKKAKKDAKKDADEEAEAKKKADAEAEAEKNKADELSATKAQLAELQTRLDALAKVVPKNLSDDDRAAFSSAQARADAVYSAFGKRAFPPLIGETVIDYRRRLVDGLKSHSAAWKDVDVVTIAQDAFTVAETQVFKDAVDAARHPADLKDDELRAIVRQDEHTGLRTTTFVGNHSFVRGMKRPPRYVKRIGASASPAQA